MTDLKAHPYAELFPMMEGEKFDAFAAGCKANGIREKIVLLGGLILDGRNRYKAAVLHDLPAAHGDLDSFRDFDREKIVLLGGLILDGRNRYKAAVLHDLPAAHGDLDSFRDFDPATEGDPLEYVIDLNLRRRHLDESQRAQVADRLVTMEHGGRRGEQAANLPLDPSPPPAPSITQRQAAEMMNVSPRSVRDAKVVREKGTPELAKAVERGELAVSAAAKAAQQAPEVQAEVVRLAHEGKGNAARTALKTAQRNTREVTLGARQRQLPNKRYGFILADPEHRFEVWSRETGLDRSPDQHYPTSTQAEIEARDVATIAAADSCLALWCTDLERGLRIMAAWGYTFKSYQVWAKDIVPAVGYTDAEIDFFAEAFGISPEKVAALVEGHMRPKTYVQVGPAGTGYWFRDRDEILLIGTRGNFVAPAMGTQPESILFAARPKSDDADRGRHSAKPIDVHLWIEANWPSLPKIELNARAARPGWDVWGNEAPQEEDDEQPDLAGRESEGEGDDGPISPGAGEVRGTNGGGTEAAAAEEGGSGTGGAEAPVELSPAELYAAVKSLVIEQQNASASWVQRKFGLSYGVAYAILDLMELEGIVRPVGERNERSVLWLKPESTPASSPSPLEPPPSPHPAKSEPDPFEIPAFLIRANWPKDGGG
jgi:N6-adenosine-specific RNA methylase IME4